MATIDVRADGSEQVDKIVFSDDCFGESAIALEIDRADVCGGCIAIVPQDEENGALSLENKGHALNMIKAIQKAIDLGWFEK